LRLQDSLAIVVFDIDHFKQVNDRHGHQVGDTVLQTFASLLAANVRDGDLAARIGGEEFVIILSGTTMDQAMQIAERIREGFAAQRFISSSGNFAATLSAGIAGGDGELDVLTLLRQADTALYDAKRSGRNRVMPYSEETSIAPSDAVVVHGGKLESVVRLRR
jgi:diguanylate cyclase (GGDEF)-like protein